MDMQPSPGAKQGIVHQCHPGFWEMELKSIQYLAETNVRRENSNSNGILAET